MNKCKCGSYAINLNSDGRGDDNPELCDVCYWKNQVKKLEDGLRECLSELIYAYRDLYPNKAFRIEDEKWYALLPKEKPE